MGKPVDMAISERKADLFCLVIGYPDGYMAPAFPAKANQEAFS